MAAQRVAEPGLGTSDLVDGGRGVTLHNVLADALGVVHDERQPLAAADGVVLGAVDAVAAGAGIIGLVKPACCIACILQYASESGSGCVAGQLVSY